MSGDSMLPFPEGCNVVSEYVQDWRNLKPQTLCIVILKGEQDFLFKQVKLHPDGLLLESLNKSYEPFVVPFYQVMEVRQYNSYHTSEVPELHDPQQIGPMLKGIWEDIKVIKAKA